MNAYVDFLAANPNGVMATVAGQQAHTRVFQYLWHEGDKLFFCTGSTKDVYEQMQQNPLVSFCTWDPKTFATMSVQGRVHFMDDRARKEKVLAENPLIKSVYTSADNPEFMLLYLDVAEVKTFSLSDGTQHQHMA